MRDFLKRNCRSKCVKRIYLPLYQNHRTANHKIYRESKVNVRQNRLPETKSRMIPFIRSFPMSPLFLISLAVLFSIAVLLIVGSYTFCVFAEQLVQTAYPEEL